MSRLLRYVLLVSGLVLTFGGLIGTARAQATPVTVTLDAENSSGETGTATLTDLGNGKTMVDVTVTGEPAGASQPMHVHSGQCGPTLGKVVYPLTTLENGKSSTTIDTTLAAIMTGGFAINGHKSAAEIGVYVFCGNIPAGAAMSTTGTPGAAGTTGTGTPEATAMVMTDTTGTPAAMEATTTAGATTTETSVATSGSATAGTETPAATAVVPETATTEATAASGVTVTETPTATATLPTTGGSITDYMIPLGLLGLLILSLGLSIRRLTR